MLTIFSKPSSILFRLCENVTVFDRQHDWKNCFNNFKRKQEATSGVPQGLVLGYLFVLFSSDLLETANHFLMITKL